KETVEGAGGKVIKEEYSGLVKLMVETRKGEAEKLMALLTEKTRGKGEAKVPLYKGGVRKAFSFTFFSRKPRPLGRGCSKPPKSH
ncbi:DUF1949 domain-containing protein, partial [Thermococcus sp.]|uniref:DUF1949 domain-containing protein n=1 Tax=Thermococcus sp. TaxID=35749 RepID=UPI002637D641